MRSMHFYNNTHLAVAVGANNGTTYTYWFTDTGHGTHIAVSGGLPVPIDTVYWDTAAYYNTADISGVSGGLTLANVAGGTVSVIDSSKTGTAISVGSVAAGVTFNCPDNSAGFVGASALFLCAGDINITGFANTSIAAGWLVNGGNAGGNITITSPSSSGITIAAPAAGQSLIFGNITLSALSANIVVSGATGAGAVCNGTYTYVGVMASKAYYQMAGTNLFIWWSTVWYIGYLVSPFTVFYGQSSSSPPVDEAWWNSVGTGTVVSTSSEPQTTPATINLYALPAVSVTGTFSINQSTGTTIILAPAVWPVLASPSAAVNGVGMGHVPSITNVLPNDSVFGVTGTLGGWHT